MALKPFQCCIQATVLGEIVKIHIAKNTYHSRMLKTFYKATLHRQPFIELGENRLYPAPSTKLGSQWRGKSSQEGSDLHLNQTERGKLTSEATCANTGDPEDRWEAAEMSAGNVVIGTKAIISWLQHPVHNVTLMLINSWARCMKCRSAEPREVGSTLNYRG